MGAEESEIELTILMPCLDEAETIGICIEKAQGYIERSQIQGEILVADNGSTDGSIGIATKLGATVINVAQRGYGAALRAGMDKARGRFIIFGDSDDSYDFSNLDAFINALRAGYDFVIGNRFQGGIKPGAMPALHKYLGNPILSALGRLFFGTQIGDFHCGLRGVRKKAFQQINLRTTGMEFASEMVVKATLAGLSTKEVPTTLSPDGRSRPPHLRPWRDGWRHLCFLLFYSPSWLFLLPGILFSALGLLTFLFVLPGPFAFAGITFDVHTLLLGLVAVTLGVQFLAFFLLAEQLALRASLYRVQKSEQEIAPINLEYAVALGGLLFALGCGGIIWCIFDWQAVDFGAVNYRSMMRLLIPSITLFINGAQIIAIGFVSSIIDIKHHTENFAKSHDP